MSDKLRVLIVDDSSVSRMMVKNQLLSQQPDWTVVEAANGSEALARAAEAAPDLITLDLNMPEMDGLEAAVKLHEAHPQARIAIVTANIQDSMRQRVQSLGILFVAMVDKPINEAGIRKILAGL
ncbi:Chemotaxis protein CheY [Andreprevotia sp. IGB-42]|uniref:response regulator transcription factor n=1 Tax=Andreprevotia sp. IGB-42 TaxID=2497473 RepID=UPI00135925C3|nr:response regulator [Andreprevotia sp. IGB-42]KAF0811748.1 Chemotaxis protein CheY [Andreprevotia sp. IGB-42]